jgi:CheY-like chemotaxis protein
MDEMLQEKRIFIVEDTSTNLAIMKTLLEGSGVKVGFDKWGLDTIPKLLAFAPVDLILLDLMFPNNVSGYDVFDKIRAVSSMTAVPIVAVSASEPGVAIPKTKAKGFAGFIGKPFSYDRFPVQIREVLSGEPVWDRGAVYVRR